jgi:hypothetical protein
MLDIKIHLYTISWNEEGMLPHFLKYYTQFCEKIFIYDNLSTDLTKEIALSYSGVEFLQYDTSGEIRDDIYLKIKNEAWKKSRDKADFVIVCDIDEFIYHHNLNELLQKIKNENISIVKSVGYNMINETYPNADSNIFDSIQYGARSTDFDKVILFNPNLIEEINYQVGAHKCVPIGKINYSINEFKLLHYKYLDLERVIQRYTQMSLRLSEYNKKNGLGFHYSFTKRKIKNQFNQLLKRRVNIFDLK